MAYQVDKFNGTFLIAVADGTIDTTTDLRLVGKNYAGYGELQNENFVHLMENFANTTPPPKPLEGQIWYDSGKKKLFFYDGTKFKDASAATVTAVAPTGLQVGEFWWDTATKQLYVWSGTDYELIGPEASPELGQTAVVTEVVQDDQGVPLTHSIIKFLVGGKVVGIISKDEFTLSSADAITGFPRIKKGYTLVDTVYDPDDTSGQNGVTSGDYVHWGTASNALKLGGFVGGPDGDYVLKSDVDFPNQVHFAQGYSLGGDVSDFHLRAYPVGTDIVFEQIKGFDSNIVFKMRVSAGDQRNVAVITKDGVVPGVTETFDMGSATLRWNNVYANAINATSVNVPGGISGNTEGDHIGNVYDISGTKLLVDAENATLGQIGDPNNILIYGSLIGSVQGNVTGTATNADALGNLEATVLTPTSTNKASIVARGSNGSVYADRFVGPADQADRVRISDGSTDPAWNAGDDSTWYRSAKTTKTAYSIAARDANGDLAANVFNGTATAARFADLAEKYLTDAEYDVGTVIAVGGEAEVTAAKAGDRALGVVSESPAFMMNSELEGGTYIALKGRVPVKVTGPVFKGQRLVPAIEAGYAQASHLATSDTFAIAMETCDGTGKKIIEAVVL